MEETGLAFILPLLALFIPVYFLRSKRDRIALWFYLGLYFIYAVFVPVTDRLLGVHSFFGSDLPMTGHMDWTLSFVYGTGILAFWAGYFVLEKVVFPKGLAGRKLQWDPEKTFRVLTVFQLVVWMLVFLNLSKSGISIPGIFDPGNREEKDILFSANWKYPWIDLLSNTLPVCLFLQWVFRPKISFLWLALLVFWLVFALLGGWRYRLILFGLFLFFHFIQSRKFNFQVVLPILFSLFLGMAWLTLNRMAIAKRQFQLVTFDLRQFDLGVFNTEFSNSRTFRATLFFMEGNEIQPPGSKAWVDFIRNRFRNKEEFPEGVRPRPWILQITKAWIPPGWPWNPNPAVTQMEEFFLTFGYWGMALGLFLVGIWVRFLDFKPGGKLENAVRLVGIALLFQWISRGFFLFQLQITLVCLIPFLLLALMASYLSHESETNPA